MSKYTKKNPLEIFRKLGNKKPANDARHECKSCKHSFPAEVFKDNGQISGVEKCPNCGTFRPMTEQEKQLAEQWRFLAVSYARAYERTQCWKFRRSHNSHAGPEDIEQIAFMGICRAAMMFREENGFAFSTLATWWMRRQLSDATQDERFRYLAVQSAAAQLESDEDKQFDTGAIGTDYVDAKEDVEYLIENSNLTSSQRRFIRSYLAGDPRGEDGEKYTKASTKSRKAKIIRIMRQSAAAMETLKIS